MDKMGLRSALCIYIVDAWCPNAVMAGGQCLLDVEPLL